jgi:integrase
VVCASRPRPAHSSRGEYGSPEFTRAYEAALAGERISDDPKKTTGTLAWLITHYRQSTAWTNLSARTRYQREPTLRHLAETFGKEPFTRVTRKAVMMGVERRASTPYMARRFKDTPHGLFKRAVKAEIATEDPTIGVELPKPPKAQRDRGHAAWTQDDVDCFAARWPIGTRQRLAFDILRFTGLRVGDAVRLGRPHVRDGVIRLRTQKTNGQVVIRMQQGLLESIAAGQTGDLAYAVTPHGKPYKVGSFGNLIRDAARAAGIRKPPHGLRKYAAIAAALAGATVPELEAMMGWTDGQTAMHYIRAADRERLGLAGSAKLERNG